ncbi:protein kinase [bacterium]|nr:protein kinase [bacterium]
MEIKILVADYDEEYVASMVSLLGNQGYKVITAGDGLETLDRFTIEMPHLVILSAILPKLHGFHVCRAIKRTDKGADTPVLIVSNIYKSSLYKYQALHEYKADDFLIKPVDQEILLQRIQYFTAHGSKRRQDRDTLQLTKSSTLKNRIKTGSGTKVSLEDKLEKTLASLMDLEDTTIPGKSSRDGKEQAPLETNIENTLVDLMLSKEKQHSLSDLAEDELDRIIDEAIIVEDVESPVPTSAKEQLVGGTAAISRDLPKAPPSSHRNDSTQNGEQSPKDPSAESAQVVLNKHIETDQVEHEADPGQVPDDELIKDDMLNDALNLIMAVMGSNDKQPVGESNTGDYDAVASDDRETGEGIHEDDEYISLINATKRGDSHKAKDQQPFRSNKLDEPDPLFQDPAMTEKATEVSVQKNDKSEAPSHLPLAPVPGPAHAVSEKFGSEQSLPDKHGPKHELGISFGKYTIMEKIAIGGMAEIFKARQRGVEGFEKLVALKRILPHLSDNKEFVRMLVDEGKIAAQLTHQNIAQIYELGEQQGYYYIAMEYVLGKDLKTLMTQARHCHLPLSQEQAALIISKLCCGLDYAHRQKDINGRDLHIVHRDISPQNVLISYEGEVKIIDFGIAKAAAKDHHTRAGALKGKILYMSPEQAWGKNIDKRSDIFSLGTLLYEMLTQQRLFLAPTEIQILQKVREAQIVPPRQIDEQIPLELEHIVLKALARNPDQRYQTAGEMQRELDTILFTRERKQGDFDLAAYMARLFQGKPNTLITTRTEDDDQDVKTEILPAPDLQPDLDEVAPGPQSLPVQPAQDTYADDDWLDTEIRRLLTTEETAPDLKSYLKNPICYVIIITVLALLLYFVFGGFFRTTPVESGTDDQSVRCIQPTRVISPNCPGLIVA